MTTNNTTIPDAKLAELKRLHAAATPGEWYVGTYSNYYGWSIITREDGCIAERWHKAPVKDDERLRANGYCIAALHNAFSAILARLEAAERERGELEAELEEARANSIEYEKDCTKALCSLAREFSYEWDGDGATADDLREFISETVADAKRRLEAAERDRDELREESAYITQQLEWVSENGGTYQKSALLDFLRRTLHGITHTATLREALAARDAQQRREGAIEAFNEMRLQAEEVGQQSGLAKKMCKIFADECIEQAAKRLREDSK